ncbi:plastid transcriptionally active 5 [Prunus dulcis]|uniref:Plastid transcriptionally active 5 n=1 Tax=Prunus dulcis TaxID=3755 RepID=A0A4Y1R4D4_PRUDU|nr:plastid transcriptionally active 5 [Prunus dulcis]
MQEALQKLGFYSGEEDMEFSSFSSGTERAVKTWQASLDAPQDGIVTAELEQLYTVAQIEGLDNKGSTLTATQKEDTNGAAVTSGTEISEVQQTLVKEGVTKVEVSEHRVFLLGENRWEDSSRLSRNQKKENVMEQASQTLKNSSWIGWKREQNVHIVKVMGLQFATYVKGQQ